MDLCLGTVQFGMNYGISKQKKPSMEQALEMLDYATQHGIDTIDTANAYGAAEDIVGMFLRKKTVPRENLWIISKLRPNLLDNASEEHYYVVMKENLEDTLVKLGLDYLDTYLLHSARYVYNDAIIAVLNRIKKEGYARKVGVSVYEVEEAKKCIESSNVDFMQLPYSVFDQRMKNGGIFELAKKHENTTQIHSRSAFIQGLIFMEEKQVPDFLFKARPIVRKIGELCKEYEISRIALAMNYVKQEDSISHLVFGVDNINQLKENICIFQHDLNKDVIEAISAEFRDVDADIVMPSLWKK